MYEKKRERHGSRPEKSEKSAKCTSAGFEAVACLRCTSARRHARSRVRIRILISYGSFERNLYFSQYQFWIVVPVV